MANNKREFSEEKAAIADVIMSKRQVFIKGAVGELHTLTEGMLKNLQDEVGTLDGEEAEQLLAEVVAEFEEYLQAGIGRAFKRFKRTHLE